MQKFESFGVRLTRLRKERGWSQRELVKRSKISAFQIGKYEKEKTLPAYWTLLELARALDVTLDYLMLGDKDETVQRLHVLQSDESRPVHV